MMKLAIALCLLALTGCASIEEVRSFSSHELCYRVAAGHTRGLSPSVFYRELESRNEDCSRYQASIAQQIRRDNASAASGLMLLQAAQPKPRATVTCNTHTWGNNIQTTCN